MSGWIKIHRSFDKWEWRDDPHMVSLFLRLLTEANFEDKKWHGQTIKRGQLIFGRKQWSEKTGFSPQTLRTCIERLKSTSEITSQSTNKFTIITIVKYEEYQSEPEASTSQSTSNLTNDQPTNNQQTTTPKEYKKKRKKEDAPKVIYPDWLPIEDFNDWIINRKNKPTPRAIELAIDRLKEYRDKGHDPKLVLQNSIMNGWEGIFEPNHRKSANNKMPSPAGG